jgi:hypothetical protein
MGAFGKEFVGSSGGNGFMEELIEASGKALAGIPGGVTAIGAVTEAPGKTLVGIPGGAGATGTVPKAVGAALGNRLGGVSAVGAIADELMEFPVGAAIPLLIGNDIPAICCPLPPILVEMACAPTP